MDLRGSRERMSAIVWVFLGLLAVAVVGLGWALFQILRQQGRLLLRLESLEQRGPDGSGYGVNGSPGVEEGLPLATTMPPFRLRDLQGDTVGLEEFRGKRVLLVHWDAGCGFCDQIAPELASLQRDLTKRKTELVLVSYGDAEVNRSFAEEHGLECQILLQREREPIAAFARLGTPVAYVLDEKGRVAKPLAIGADEVPRLAREAACKSRHLRTEKSLAASRIAREGLPAGTRAPAFALPDLFGRTVALEDYAGRSILLVFSDPDCGPCDALLPDLARLHRQDRDRLAIVVVGRGSVEENRRKASAYNVDFPVLLQPAWRVSKEYGIFATPVAFLIDEEGVIARDVAKGAPEILSLAEGVLATGRGAPMA
jgi:peroxiredoxin